MSSAPGMAPPPGVPQPSGATQANRPSGLPPSFQPPANLPNINFNAPVIRLGASSLPTKPGGPPGGGTGRREYDTPVSAGSGRPGLGLERGGDRERTMRDGLLSLAPPSTEEKLRTVFIHKIPEGVGGDSGIERLLGKMSKLRRWDSAKSHLSDHKGELFGFAQFEDMDSLAVAVEALKEIDVPVKKQAPVDPPPGDDATFEGIEKVQLQVSVDPNTRKYLEAYLESRGDEAEADIRQRLEAGRLALQAAVRDLFYPRPHNTGDGDGDVAMGDGNGVLGDNVEVINIPLAQEDELADIPAEMREVVAAEIAAFRDRSNRRDMERLRREEEFEEQERIKNGAPRASRLDSPPPGASNGAAAGARSVPNAPSGPRGVGGPGRGVSFVNGGTNGDYLREEDDTDASDEELNRRELSKQRGDEEKQYLEAERKWANRERQRAAALEREQQRDKAEDDSGSRRKEEHQERDKGWDDEREAARKTHSYYRDRPTWVRKRTQDRAEEEARDEVDRRAEADERRRRAAETETARGLADSFLEKQAREMEIPLPEAAAPQRFTISFGAAAQKAQAQRAAGTRRTIAEVEGLLDDEEQDATVKRQLIPIKFEPSSDVSGLSEEEITKAVRSLAQEIPTQKEGLWAWDVKWDYMDDSIIVEKLRPFVEKKVVEYLGVQEQFLVEVVEEHLRKHGKPGELVEELAEALDDAAEDLVKKLWRMVIFFTESEKRGLPA